MEAGGYATARGEYYRTLWAVRQLLLVLAEEVRSVRIEPAGREGEGVDIIVVLPDGRREYQQCKRSNRQEGKWTLGELASRGVLRAIVDRLRGEPVATFRLVSADAAPDLRDLAESARDSLGAEIFFRDQIPASQKREAAFQRFCSALGFDPEKERDVYLAHDLLRRCEVTQVGDGEAERRDLRSQARRWVDGDPTAVVATLESLAVEKLRCEITVAAVDACLREAGLHPRRLDRDPRILPAVQQTQGRFERSLGGQLIGGRLLRREGTEELLELLADLAGPRFIALHGPAGAGKSGVLLEATRRLGAEQIPFLPIRLDRQRPRATPRQFGESLDLPESPALCLGALSADRTAVLLLDQLDALRWTGADAGQALDTCRELVREAMGFPNLRVVACCRTFDLEHDPQIQAWIKNQKARKLAVHRLSEKTVKEVVSSLGADPSSLSSHQLDLLRTIQLLRTWEEASKVTEGAVEFANDHELLDAFWRSRFKEAERMGVGAETLRSAVDKIVSHMDSGGTLFAPSRLLQDQPTVEEALQSLNVITVSDGKIAFCHQIYLDHRLAHLLLRRLDEEATSVMAWLTSSHQGLYRREQLRLILEMLREESFDRYLPVVRELLSSERVRFHLKQLVLEVLGRVEEIQSGEIETVLPLLQDEAWRDHVIADVLFGRPEWFSAVDDAGVVASWLESESEVERDQALTLITTVIEDEGERCCRLLAALVDRGEEWPQRLAGVLRQTPANDSSGIFDLRLRLTERGVRWSYLKWESLDGPDLRRLVHLLSVILEHRSPEERESPVQPRSALRDLVNVSLGEASLEQLAAAGEALLPRASQLIGRDKDAMTPQFVKDGGWRADLRAFLRKLVAELVRRDGLAAIEWVEEHPTRLAELLLLEALPQVADAEAADRGLQWLMAEPHRLRLRWAGNESPWAASRSAVERLTRFCSPDACSAFERFLLEFREPGFREHMERRHRSLLLSEDTFLSNYCKFSESALRVPSTAGATAYHLLTGMPHKRLSEIGRREREALERKFPSGFLSGPRIEAGYVKSPLPADRLNALSDKTWLDIIRNNAMPKGSGWRRGGYRDGRVEKSSPVTFARDLATATAREPGRFARLALRFPHDANPYYFLEVIQGLRRDSQDDGPGEDATVEELEALLALPQVAGDSSIAIAAVRLIGSRADLDWGPATLDFVGAIAEARTWPNHWRDAGASSTRRRAVPG